jgi:uncharacterized MAPEG superfamily protein
MTQFWEFASSLQQHISATARRSDVLKPFAWLLAIVASLLAAITIGDGPEWLQSMLALGFVALIGLYALIYVICFIVDRDALRSESYSLNKMAIKHKLIGDSSTGVFNSNELEGKPLITEQSPKRIGRRVPKSGTGET